MIIAAPYEVLNPEFEYSLDKQAPTRHHYAGISLELGEANGKYATKSVLDIETANRSGYGLTIAIQKSWDSEWEEVSEINRVRIAIHGDYERDDLLTFLQQAGLLSLTVYGKMEAS
jgi:hypothetical protein